MKMVHVFVIRVVIPHAYGELSRRKMVMAIHGTRQFGHKKRTDEANASSRVSAKEEFTGKALVFGAIECERQGNFY